MFVALLHVRCIVACLLFDNVLGVVILAIYAIYSHNFAFTAPWDHLDVVVRLDSLRGDQRSLLLLKEYIVFVVRFHLLFFLFPPMPLRPTLYSII